MVRVHINDVDVREYRGDFLHGRAQATKLSKSSEGFSHLNTSFIQEDSSIVNPLILAVFSAFANHIPLEVSPDVIFNTILQGVSQHVATNPEYFRNVFVTHEGKKDLGTRDDSLIKGSWDNKWDNAILDLGNQIYEDMSGEAAKKVLSTKFTTTGLAERTAHTAVFMDVVKAYYRYTVFTMCGIPWIDIGGTKEDWVLLGKSLNSLLTTLKLTSWNTELQTIISHFVRAYDADIDQQFWNKIYYYHGPEESGDVSRISGWIAKLFLYVKGQMNPLIGKPDEIIPKAEPKLKKEFAAKPWLDHSFWQGGLGEKAQDEYTLSRQPASAIDLGNFSCGTTRTNFVWDYYGRKIPMVLVAGLVGVSVTASGALKPEIGWLVAEDHEDECDASCDSDESGSDESS